MSDNLAHKLSGDNSEPGKSSGSGFAGLGKPVTKSPSQELELNRKKYQATQQQNQEQETNSPDTTSLEDDNQENDYDEVGSSQPSPNTAQGEKSDIKDEEKKNEDKEQDKNKDGDKGQNKEDKKDENKEKIENKDGNKGQNKDEKKGENKNTADSNKSGDDVAKTDKKQGALGPKLEKENLKIPERKSDKPGEANKPKEKGSEGASTAQQLNRAKNIASKALSGDAVGAGEEIAGATTQAGTQWLLTTLWGAVWLDWTLLSLLGLNVFLVFSLLLPQYVCQFGDDYLIGKWIPSKELAKWTEIIILMIINVFVLSIIIMIIYFIYGVYNCGLYNWFNIAVSWLLPGGETGTSETIKRCFK